VTRDHADENGRRSGESTDGHRGREGEGERENLPVLLLLRAVGSKGVWVRSGLRQAESLKSGERLRRLPPSAASARIRVNDCGRNAAEERWTTESDGWRNPLRSRPTDDEQ